MNAISYFEPERTILTPFFLAKRAAEIATSLKCHSRVEIFEVAEKDWIDSQPGK